MSIDDDTAREAGALLSTAIAELMEDAHTTAAIISGREDAAGMTRRADELAAVGLDIAALAQAMAVLSRRTTTAC